MKKLVLITLLFTICISLVNAQIVDPKKVAKKQGTKRANSKIEKGVDKGFDKLEEGIGSLFGKKKKKKKSNKKSTENTTASSNQTNQQLEQANNAQLAIEDKSNVVWSRFDFVPGDEVIFEDGPDINEENGEFPSRWDLVKGNSEIININGANVVSFPQGGTIIPYLANSKEDYLPEIFTIEFDTYFRPKYSRRIWISLFDEKNQRNTTNNKEIGFHVNSAWVGDSEGVLPNKQRNHSESGGWQHFSIAYTKGKLKVYINDTRLVNIPHYQGNPTGITIQMDGYSSDKPEDLQCIKNFRIAKGGVKYYDRVMQDGKIICNGIRFDVNKASLKPESMGPINKIYQLLKKQPNLNFSIEGHTDSDGDDVSNKKLSEARAKVVMEKLIQMGISSSRLSYAGFGESKPIDNNSTPEGKANNRRVEFVKSDKITVSSKGSVSGGNSSYDKIIASNINKEFDKLSDEFYTPISGPNGIENGPGTIFLFFTSERNLGKMEILDVDKDNNYMLTIRYVTYSRNGEIVSESDHFEIEGTFAFDLDKGSAKEVTREDQDFLLNIGSKTNSSFALGGENIAIRKYQ